MLTLVSGGAASGKSEYAEELILRSAARPLVYLATMEIWDEEDRRRVDRHRALRKDKGFQTVEAPRRHFETQIPRDSAVLLECMSNICVNECFGPEGPKVAYERIWRGILHLQQQCRDLVIVSNDLFSDGVVYTPESEEYRRILAKLNCTIAAQADQVWEVCCGIPILWKGAQP